jgi:phospholipid/cholesterol/gamma-HCH transport system substrate-binding protein
MEKQQNATRAGIFIVVCGILVLVIIFAITGFSSLRNKMVHRAIMFQLTDNVGGLRIGDDVRIGGVRVGSVKDIDIQANGQESPSIIVIARIPQKYIVTNNAVVRIETTFTGVSVLNFESLGTGTPLDTETALPGRSSAMSEVFAQVRAAAPDARVVLSEAAGLVNDIRSQTVPKANHTIDEIGALATSAREQVNPNEEKTIAFSARRMMDEIAMLSSDTRPDFRSTMANLKAVSDSARDKVPGILENVDQATATVNKSLERINTTLAELHDTVVNAREATGTVRTVLVRNQSRINAMIESLKATGDNLKGASAEIRRSPWRLLYRPKPNEMANLNLYDSARQFADGASQLDDALGALRDAANDPKVDEQRLTELMQQVEERFKRFNEVEEELWKQVKE